MYLDEYCRLRKRSAACPSWVHPPASYAYSHACRGQGADPDRLRQPIRSVSAEALCEAFHEPSPRKRPILPQTECSLRTAVISIVTSQTFPRKRPHMPRRAGRRGRGLGIQSGRLGCRSPAKRTVTQMSVDYACLVGNLSRPLAAVEVGQVLLSAAGNRYQGVCTHSSLAQFTQSGATYLFDLASAVDAEQEDRTVAAWAVTPAVARRDVSYQRGFPLTADPAGPPVDRGSGTGSCRRSWHLLFRAPDLSR